jgi:hypothetical protein
MEGRVGRPSWIRGDGHSETWRKPQHLQGRPLPTEREGLACPASQRPTTIKYVLIHFPGNAETGGPGTQAGNQVRYGTGMHQQGMPFEVRR